ncbi:TraR/DksA family transcriptional regulator [Streptomyces fulvoviolaceus]|uniref:TraR/DksA family transcriptional regulator n=1 Tax=Streptomyces fulvoviolaceus TaxID=285535 RepID=UPI0021BF2EA3|nr:TraR/DksA family transcriptional regulator [Streptomyces fulvoviolaceus]MCT9082727.1 TraR/DksA family transcriptional regulator [Streptomyces fulvoviolaceus]
MVAKKTAEQQSASGRSTHARASGGEAKDAGGKKSTQGTSSAARAAKAVKTLGAAAKKTATKRTATKKTAAKKTATKKSAATAPVEGAERPAAKKAPARKTVAKKAAAAKKTAARKSASKTTSAGRKSTAKKAGAAQAAKQTGATTVVAKKTPGTATAAKTAVPKARVAAAVPGELAVRPGEDPWTPEEVAEARAELTAEALRLRTEITTSEQSLVGLMRDSGDGAGDDQADTGTKNITRESEMALAANAREMLIQTERALGRLDAGTYGLCENCGNPIGKARMQAFPRATLCVECKQKQERRY